MVALSGGRRSPNDLRSRVLGSGRWNTHGIECCRNNLIWHSPSPDGAGCSASISNSADAECRKQINRSKMRKKVAKLA